MQALVTGGAGFIGSHLVEALLADGHRVRVLDNFSAGKREHLRDVMDDIELHEGDIRDMEACRRACAGVDYVWHLAAIASVPASVDDPLTCHAVNATGTLQMLIAARDAGVRRLVFASSCAVYGANPLLPRDEVHLPMPESPYAATKLMGESYVRQFPHLYGLEAVALRFFNIYGPRQDPASQYGAAVPKFIDTLLRGEVPTVFGDGEQNRDFVYVKDCVQANLLAAFTGNREVVGGAFNVAVGYTTTVNALLATIQTCLGTDVAPHRAPARPGEVRYSDGRNDRLVAATGFAPRWTLEAGLRETAGWFVQAREGTVAA